MGLLLGSPSDPNIEIQARKISTTLKTSVKNSVKKKKKKNQPEYINISSGDSLEWSKKIVFAGFDKQLNSSIESFHVSNHTVRTILRLDLTITYLDTEGRMLHRRRETLKTNIPAGETHKIDIKSFDTQHTFYYILSSQPKRSAIPFDTKIALRGVVFASADPENTPDCD